MFRKLYVAIPFGALALAPTPAAAAPVTPTQQATSNALILVPLTLTKIQDLRFGTVVPSALSGVVSINASTGARTVAGGLTGVPSDVGQRAYFGAAGTGNQQVIITYVAPAELTSTTDSADKIPVLALTLDGSPIRTISPVTRSFFFGIGGVILINADQPEGLYEANFDVTANYQ